LDRGVTEPGEIGAPNPKVKPPGPKKPSLIAFQSSRDGYWEINQHPALSPNGKKIAFRSSRSGGGDIYVMNTDGSDQTRVTDHPSSELQPHWSPNGQKIAFVRTLDLGPEAYGDEIYVMNADGSDQTRLTDNLEEDWGPSWSPDGSKIAFINPREGNFDIYVMDADGSNQTRLTYSPGGNWWPDWSPDGKRIAFQSFRDNNMDIYVMDADGSNQTRLTYSPGNDWVPDWSPDGKYIAFYSDRVTALDREIYVMNADGTEQVQITDSEIDVPAWHAQNMWPSWGRVKADEGAVAEALIGSSYLAWWAASQWTDPSMALSVAAEELTSSRPNFGMEDLSTEPRQAYDNTPSYAFSRVNERPWFLSYVALSSVYEGIRMIEQGVEIGGRGGPDNARAMAFAKFVQGLAHGWLALMFDQAFILDETIYLETDELMLTPYTDVMAAAVAEFEEAIAIADATTFTLPDTWIRGLPLTSTELSQLAHSYLARMMTQVARTPSDRAAVDWPTVISHVDQGIQTDVVIEGEWNRWWDGLKMFGTRFDWTRADYKTIGWLDTSGNFAAWLATPVADRDEIEIITPDARIMANGDPQSPGTDFEYAGPSEFPPEHGTYHFSFYGHHVYGGCAGDHFEGPITHMTTVEMQLIKAEGLLGTGGPSQEVADIINATGVGRGQLSPASASESQSDLMDKLIYEKRIEGFLLCGGCAFFDRRGFGPLAATGPNFHQGLVEGTPLHFPVPGIELERLGLPYYTFGGLGNEMGAAGVAAAQPARVRASDVYHFSSEMTAEEKLSYVESQLAAGGAERPEQPRRH
jgi:TolB protein